MRKVKSYGGFLQFEDIFFSFKTFFLPLSELFQGFTLVLLTPQINLPCPCLCGFWFWFAHVKSILSSF